MTKLLIIRLSSIGDIILTTPVLRAVRAHYPDAQIGYLTKKKFADAIRHNPAIDKLHLYDGSLRETITELKAEGYDQVIDLHKNLRSFIIRTELALPATTFPKQNHLKMQMVVLKRRIAIPHIVDRYAKAVETLGVQLDEKGLDFYYPAELDEWVRQQLTDYPQPYGLSLSASYETKRWLPEYYREYLQKTAAPMVLFGGKAEEVLANEITEGLPTGNIYNAVGKTSLLESAALLRQCTHLITPDTGMMHIAAALQVPSISLWGNTVPEFGMTPYRAPHIILEEKMGCRPCSRLGHHSCPKGHFNCMKLLTPDLVKSSERLH